MGAGAELTNAKLSAVHFPANLGQADLDATNLTHEFPTPGGRKARQYRRAGS